MEEIRSAETSVDLYRTTRGYDSEDSTQNSHWKSSSLFIES
jgi:hypothetical protein